MTELLHGVTLPDFVVAVVDVIPAVQHAVVDVVDEEFHLVAVHQLSAEVDPFALAFALDLLAEFAHGEGGVLLQEAGDVGHGVIDEHVAVGVVGLTGFEDAHFPVTAFHAFAENLETLGRFGIVVEEILADFAQFLEIHSRVVSSLFQEVCLAGPSLNELARLDGLLHGVGSEGFELDVLDAALAGVALLVFGGVAGDGVHIVHPPIGGHHL